MQKGLKIDNSNSLLKPAAPVVDFRNRINEILKSEEEQNKLAAMVVTGFNEVLKSKVLDSAKSMDEKELEGSRISDLLDFARIINDDENQEDNLGTISVLIVLCKGLLHQRDRINELEFLVNKLNAQIKSIKPTE